MTLGTQNMLVLFIGLLVVRLVVTKGYLSYVRPGLYLPLLIAGAVIALISAITLWTAPEGALRRKERHPGHGSGAGWLLLLPLFALMAIDPAPLGAYAAGFRSAAVPTVDANTTFPPLPPGLRGAIPLQINHFAARALFGEPGELEGVPVRLTGFVTEDAEVTDGFVLTRFVVGCCAADAVPAQVIVHGEAAPAPADTWLELEGTWRPPEKPIPDHRIHLARVHLDMTGASVIPQPEEPYESAF
ncbi:MAG: TIGR03943 family putative permease subunit [Actinomycetota bacterium]